MQLKVKEFCDRTTCGVATVFWDPFLVTHHDVAMSACFFKTNMAFSVPIAIIAVCL